jgi:hypothetical protein
VFVVTPKWVAALQVLAAETFLHFRRLMLGRIIRLCEDHPPKFAISRTAWDETGEKLALDVPGADAGVRRSCWQIMVAKVRLIVGFGPDLRSSVIDFTFVVPPIAIATPSADQIYNALWFRERVRPLLVGRGLIFAKATYALDLSGADAAASNERLEAHLVNTCQRGAWRAHFFCRLRRAQPCETLLLSLCQLKLLSRTYSLIMLLQTSGFFPRSALASPKFLAPPSGLTAKPYASRGPPPAAAESYSAELQAYLTSHWRQRERPRRQGQTRLHQRHPDI